MHSLNLDKVRQYVNENIDEFHRRRANSLSTLTLAKLISKNPYLFRAKNVTKASELVQGTMSAFLSSSEEKMFGDFLEGLAVFIAQETTGGMKSSSPGIDLEFKDKNVHYVVSIKSGPNWGNSSQQEKLGEHLNNALTRLKQSRSKIGAEAVLGICYGKTKTVRHSRWGYLKLVGQNFWTFISGDREFYKTIIEPVSYQAKKHNDLYLAEQSRVENRLTKALTKNNLTVFCAGVSAA